tara:strand:- start:1582 stop:2265 length:684 start_codon:yes stop_codon:yes gene_type:complete
MQSIADEWLRRVEAEYRSAATAQHFTLWLIQAGASPDLIVDGMHVAEDEIGHASMSHQVFLAAGGTGSPAMEQESLGLVRRRKTLEEDLLIDGVRSFCLGETVAVPLFQRMREGCTIEIASEALEQILVDEVRHRDFGWTLLDWLLSSKRGPEFRETLQDELPSMIAAIAKSYQGAEDASEISSEERSWGLLPGSEYAEVFERCYQRDYLPRFAACEIALPPKLIRS